MTSLLPPSHLFLDLLEGPGDRDNYFFLSFAVFLGFGFCFVGFCGLREDFDLGCLGNDAAPLIPAITPLGFDIPAAATTGSHGRE